MLSRLSEGHRAFKGTNGAADEVLELLVLCSTVARSLPMEQTVEGGSLECIIS
jgi:hypothetical protein